jgi:DNA-binding transcriptional LysR family regulator
MLHLPLQPCAAEGRTPHLPQHPDDSQANGQRTDPSGTAQTHDLQTGPAQQRTQRDAAIEAIARLVQAGLGVAALPDFILSSLYGVERLGQALPGCNTDLWLLTRPDCLSLRSVQTLFEQLAPLLRKHLKSSA